MADTDKGPKTAQGGSGTQAGSVPPEIRTTPQPSNSATSATGSTTATMAGGKRLGADGTPDHAVSGSPDGSTASFTGESARRYAEDAKHAASDVAGRAKAHGKSILEHQKGAAAGQADTVAHAMHRTASQLEEEGQAQAGHYVGMLADRLEDFGRLLREKDMDGLLADAQQLSRRAPGTFFAGSLVAGFLLARLLKSSSQRQGGSHGAGSTYPEAREADAMPAKWRADSGQPGSSASGNTARSTMAAGINDGIAARGGGADTAGATAASLSTTPTTPTSSTSASTSGTNPGGNSHGNR